MKKSLLLYSTLLMFTCTIFTANAQKNGLFQKNKPGMVSFTYRHSLAKNMAATLDTIKNLGVTNMEFSNLFGKTAAEIKQMLDERGMKCTSFGVSYPDMLNKPAEVALNAKTLGASFVRVAWIPHQGAFTADDARKAINDFNSFGKLLKEQYNLVFCYHNHGYEFQPYEDGTLFDLIAKSTNPNYVSFELDILWAHHGGADPAALLTKYSNRFKLMHLKDLKKGIAGNNTGSTDSNNDVALGTGQINLPAIFKAAKKSVIENYYIEDESNRVNEQVPVTLNYLSHY